MSTTDWIVLVITLVGIITYGLYKSRTSKNLEGYFLSNRSMPWYLVLLSIMGTQASAIYLFIGTRSGIYRWDAFCAVLFWVATGNDYSLYHICTLV